uniref:UL49.5 envelope/tegument protein n=1 Tax=Anatid alphaherpesvirus 2 TaxID=3080522 RepID=A0AAU0K6M6_9ALPH
MRRLIAIVCLMLLLGLHGAYTESVDGRGRQEPNSDFWAPGCSAMGVSLAFSSVFSVLFYLGLTVAVTALLAGSYHACFRLFAKEMFRYDW